MTLRWAAAEPGAVANVFLDIDRARNWDEFKRAISRFGGPGQNFVYADVDGNIGYHAGGKLPIRRDYAGDVPVDGSSGKFEWEGYIPFDELPQAWNPPDGFIVTANQNPFPADYPYRVSGSLRFALPFAADSRHAAGRRQQAEARRQSAHPERRLQRVQQISRAATGRRLWRTAKGPSQVFTDAMAMLRDMGRADGSEPRRAVDRRP